MKNQSMNKDEWSDRYNIRLSVRNFNDIDQIDIQLYQPELDINQVQYLLHAYGYNCNHFAYQELVSQVRGTFTLSEAGDFLKCVSTFDVVGIEIKPAIILVADPSQPKQNNCIRLEEFHFSSLDTYSLQFEIVGRYEMDDLPF